MIKENKYNENKASNKFEKNKIMNIFSLFHKFWCIGGRIALQLSTFFAANSHDSTILP